MSVVSSVKDVLWARRRRPDEVRYFAALAHERFEPDELLQQAMAAEQAGFDGVCCPRPPGAVVDGADGADDLGQRLGLARRGGTETKQPPIGPAVTAIVHRYNPVVLAQMIATLELLAPGRAFLGVGSGEAMNEVPAGLDWPSPDEQLARTEEALTIITRLLDGETVDFDGTLLQGEGRSAVFAAAPPSAGLPVSVLRGRGRARRAAGRRRLDARRPREGAEVISAYRSACEDAGREPGEIILQGVFSVAETDDAALEQAREWKGTMVDEHYTDPIADPAAIYRRGEQEVRRLDLHEADHRGGRPGHARQAHQDAGKARRHDDGADERVGERPARRTSRLRRAGPAGAARAVAHAEKSERRSPIEANVTS